MNKQKSRLNLEARFKPQAAQITNHKSQLSSKVVQHNVCDAQCKRLFEKDFRDQQLGPWHSQCHHGAPQGAQPDASQWPAVPCGEVNLCSRSTANKPCQSETMYRPDRSGAFPMRLGGATSPMDVPDFGWLYLAGVLDLHSCKIVGWAMDARDARSADVCSLKHGCSISAMPVLALWCIRTETLGTPVLNIRNCLPNMANLGRFSIYCLA